jgi:hypothetical protein
VDGSADAAPLWTEPQAAEPEDELEELDDELEELVPVDEVDFDAVPVLDSEEPDPLSDDEDEPEPESLLPAVTEAEEPLRESVR